jgi:hypothetical protein
MSLIMDLLYPNHRVVPVSQPPTAVPASTSPSTVTRLVTSVSTYTSNGQVSTSQIIETSTGISSNNLASIIPAPGSILVPGSNPSATATNSVALKTGFKPNWAALAGGIAAAIFAGFLALAGFFFYLHRKKTASTPLSSVSAGTDESEPTATTPFIPALAAGASTAQVPPPQQQQQDLSRTPSMRPAAVASSGAPAAVAAAAGPSTSNLWPVAAYPPGNRHGGNNSLVDMKELNNPS